MPINREAIQVAGIRAGGVLRTAQGGQDRAIAEAYGQLAGASANLAARAGRLYADQDVARATAWAERVEINEGEGGGVMIPEPAEAFTTAAGQRAADRTLMPRMAARIRDDLEGQLNEARDANQYSRAGFEQASDAIVNGYLEAMPDQLRGVTGDIAVNITRRMAGRIGWNEGQRDLRVKASDFAVASQQALADIEAAVLAGDDAEAARRASDLATMGDDLERQGAILPHEVVNSLSEAQALAASGEIFRTVREQPVAEGWKLYQSLLSGDDPELVAQFPTPAARQQVASRLATYLHSRTSEERARAKAGADLTQIERINRGGQERTDKNRDLLDRGVGMELSPGTAGAAATPETWLDGGALKDPAVWDRVRRAGMAPTSLQVAFRRAVGGTVTPDQQQNLYRTWISLRDGLAPDGGELHIADDLPKEAVGMMTAVEALVEWQGQPLAQAWDLARASFNADRPMLYGRLVDAGTIDADRTSEEQMGGAIRNAVRERLTSDLGAPVSSEDLDRAVMSFRMAAVHIDPSDAMDMVSTQAEKLLPESAMLYGGPGVGPVARGRMAPEAAYSAPDDPGFLPYKITTPSWDSIGISRVPTWFEGWAGQKLTAAGVSGKLGEDLFLMPYGGDHAKPRYQVWTVGEDGVGHRAMDDAGRALVLNPLPDWRDHMADLDAQDAAERAAADRAAQAYRDRRAELAANRHRQSDAHARARGIPDSPDR